MGWKTVYINEECSVSLALNSLKVKFEDEYINVSLNDIETVVFAHDKMTISIPIISALIEKNIGIIVCNKSRDPLGIFMPYNNHSLVFKQIDSQISWRLTRKKRLWKLIIQNKIRSERKLLEYLGVDELQLNIFKRYEETVETDDNSNREGAAARLYYDLIFGKNFIRHSSTTYNFCLDYGYKILASYISRFIASRGYLVQLGIHHRGESNPFNLTYDFIETFRVLIDFWVISNINENDEFMMEHRLELTNILNYTVRVDKKRQRLSKAIDIIIDSYFSFLNENSEEIKSIDYLKFYEFEEAD